MGGSTGCGAPGASTDDGGAVCGAACSARTSDCWALLSRIRSCSRSDSARSTRSRSQSRSAVTVVTRSRSADASASLPCVCGASCGADIGSCGACGATASSGRVTSTRPCAVRVLCNAPLRTRRLIVSTDTPSSTAASATETWREAIGASIMIDASLRLRCSVQVSAPHHGSITARARAGPGLTVSGPTALAGCRLARMVIQHRPPAPPAVGNDEVFCDSPTCRVCGLWQRTGESRATWLARITRRCRAELGRIESGASDRLTRDPRPVLLRA